MPNKGIVISGARVAFALVAATAMTLLTGCGSDSGSIDNVVAGTKVTASFAGATMPGAVAYQSGESGEFQKLALSGSGVSFTLPSGTSAYSFAYICPTFAAVNSYSNESIVRATTTDTTSLSLACPSLSGNVSATFDASAISGVTSVMLFSGNWSDQYYERAGSVGLLGVPTGTFDIALEAVGANGTLALQIQRGVNVTGSTTVAFPPMTAADEVGSAPVSVTGASSGATNVGFSTTYNTSGGLSVILPAPFNGVPQSTHPTVPSSQSQPGDFYLIQANASLPAQHIGAEVSSNSASGVAVALPSPSGSFTAPTAAAFPTFSANTGGFTVAGTIVYSSWTQFQTPAVNPTVYNTYLYVTKTWLGTSSTFSVPDLSTLSGFAPAPPNSALEFWSLYSTAGTPLQFSPLQQSGVEALTSPASVQSISTSGAFTVP